MKRSLACSRARLGLVLAVVLASLVGALPAAANPAGTGIVISQVYGGGGNSGATYTNDFIELYNPTGAAVPLTGWSVQYASTTGTSWQKTDLVGSIPAGGRYLIQEAAGTGGTVGLPSPDVSGTIPMSAGAGKVALVNTNTAILAGTSCPIPNVVDFVGYGTTTNCFEGSGPTSPSLTNTTAAHRSATGADTDNNAVDFTVAAPSPRTPATVDLTVNGITANEGDSGTTSFDFVVSLSTPARAGGVTFDIATADGSAFSAEDYVARSLTGQTIPAGSSTYTFSVLVNGDVADEGNETFFVNATNVTGASVADGQGQGTILNDDTDFCALPYTGTYSIQGSGNTAAITGNVTTQGVVVGDFEGSASLQGFYLQDLTGDGNAATSDGIFVFTGSANLVSAGQIVRVTGFARERNTQTTLNGSNSSSAAVPAANIVQCGNATVAATDVTMPFTALDAPERYEGMLVRLPQELVIAEYFNYDRFGEIVLGLPFPGESRPFTPTAIDAPGGPALARLLSNTLRRITLDDVVSAQNPESLRHPNGAPFSLSNRFRGGDTVENTLGVLGFDFGLYRIMPTGPAEYAATNPRPAAPDPVGGSLRVAAMNTLNFFLTLDYPTANPLDNKCGASQTLECRGADFDQPSEFPRQRDKLLAALSGLNGDVIGLNEIENTPGVDPLGDPNGVVPGLNGLHGPGAYAHIDTGVLGTDAIRVGMIYKPSKVAPVGTFQVLTSAVDSRFIDTKSRPALAQTFEELATGARFTVVVNHLKSKGSDCLDVGDPDRGDGQGNCNVTRTNAARALVDWAASDPTGSGDADFLIIGDLNAYTQEDPITAIKAGPDDTPGTADDYTNLVARFLGTYAYSYVFDGMAGYLDHALANAPLTPQVTGVAEWHINADEPDVLDYDTSFKGPAQDALYEANASRSSDHDPILVGLDLGPTYADLCRLVTRVVTNADVVQGLCDKLAAAEAADARGNTKARDNVLNAFRNQVDAQTGKSITAADAATLKSLLLEL